MRTGKIAFLLLSVAFVVVSVRGQKPEEYVKNELLIKFRSAESTASVKRLLRQAGAVELEKLGDLGWRRIKIAAGRTVEQSIPGMGRIEGVEAVQPNFYYHLLVTPNDPQYLANVNTSMYGLGKISAPAAWDLTTGSATVVVADIDTGMKYTHEDLAANVWTNPGETPNNGIDDDGNGFIDDYHGYDFRFNDPDPMDEFSFGHGTHTAGTIGAAGNNSLGVVGVNWNVKVMPIKIYSASGTDSTSAMLVNAYNYVRLMRNRGVNIRVTNNSYGDCPEACGYDQATRDAIDAMGDAGILNVFAAGNNGINTDVTPKYPASYTSPSILSVAASDQNDNRPSFSNFGLITVDLAAPGVGILSTTRTTDSSYGVSSGTSMATPHVAGAAALLSAFNPALSPASLKATLMNTVDPLPVTWAATQVKTGGRLNIAAALQNQTVCSFGLTNNSITVPTKGGTFSVNVTAGQNCDYSAKSDKKWIQIDGPGIFSGSGTLTFRVLYNPTITREGTISIGGQQFTVRQSRVG